MNNTAKYARLAVAILAVGLIAAPGTAEARHHGGAGALGRGWNLSERKDRNRAGRRVSARRCSVTARAEIQFHRA